MIILCKLLKTKSKISRNNEIDIQAILNLLSDHPKLARISRSMIGALNSARKNRIGLIEIVKNVVAKKLYK